MSRYFLGFIAIALATPALVVQGEQPNANPSNVKITWKKTIVDKTFRSEGVAAADVNKDGKMDIITGDVWYEAPDWKMHPMRKERSKNHVWNPAAYSESFGVFSDDFNGDGYPDAIVVPFPGKECFWYENPGKDGGLWKEHLLTTSACNETPIFVDLFKTGKKTLVMAWQPGKEMAMGEMCYFLPNSNPTDPWKRVSISGPSAKGKEVPYTQRFSHGLGHGDVNGDGRNDILCPGGWWEQPASLNESKPWVYHKSELGPICADMHTLDVDGDGKADILTSSAHNTGMWWHQQKDPGAFFRQQLYVNPADFRKPSADCKLTVGEAELHTSLVKMRESAKKSPWRTNATLCEIAKARNSNRDASADAYKGTILADVGGTDLSAEGKAEQIKKLESMPIFRTPGLEVGLAIDEASKTFRILVGSRKQFVQFGQSHALHLVDMNGDGVLDLVTGRRYWAHGPNGDDYPADPAYLFWFEGKRDRKGVVSFTPNEIDDDSGIGTQFAIVDMNGDGIPDIVVSNKRGVFVFIQIRTPSAAPTRRE